MDRSQQGSDCVVPRVIVAGHLTASSGFEKKSKDGHKELFQHFMALAVDPHDTLTVHFH